MTTETDELSTWERARRGDPAAFGAMFDLHQARVFRQARRLTHSEHDAEDVTALVFLEAWRRREAVHVVDGSVLPWLTVTTNNVARNSERSRNRHRALLAKLHGEDSASAATAPDHAAEVDERLDRQATARTVAQALDRLPRRDRDVIALCLIQGLSTAEAAAALGVAPGTVKSRLSRARRRLSADVTADLTLSADVSSGGER
ncbi:RNA polymerase sigma factor [Herbiconiux sp. P18]|uniref:RNA polymerase sigma factor n=1 Tax=Herbiconiux liangxiaofengii TaxID=3342795 RepID=UPI0035B720FE